MAQQKRALIVGGTSGVGLALAQRLAERGDQVVITGRDAVRAQAVAGFLGQGNIGLGFDLADPASIPAALTGVGAFDRIALVAVERDCNAISDYDLMAAQRAVTVKLVGYAAVMAAVKPQLRPAAAVVLVGGIALLRPYPGSTSVSIVNGGVVGLARTLAVELAPVRVNVIHPGLIDGTQSHADAPAALVSAVLSRTPEQRLVTADDIAKVGQFLLDTPGVNGAELIVDGGFHLQ